MTKRDSIVRASRAFIRSVCKKLNGRGRTKEELDGIIFWLRVEGIEGRIIRLVRYLDKLVDESAKGKPME